MRRGRNWLIGTAVLGLGTLLAPAAAPGVASAAVRPPAGGTASLVGQQGSYVVGNQSLSFPSIPAPGLRGTSTWMFVLRSPGHDFQLWFAPPAGTEMAVGAYEQAQRADSRAPGHPGIDLFGDGRGCNVLTGRFDVDQLDIGVDGLPTLFAARFEIHCEGFMPAVTGTISYSGPVHSYALSTNTLDFGTVGNREGSIRSFAVTNDGNVPVQLVSATVSQPSRVEFVIAADGCTGLVLAPGSSCTVSLRFDPHGGPGARSAAVTLADETGFQRSVELGGVSRPGRGSN